MTIFFLTDMFLIDSALIFVPFRPPLNDLPEDILTKRTKNLGGGKIPEKTITGHVGQERICMLAYFFLNLKGLMRKVSKCIIIYITRVSVLSYDLGPPALSPASECRGAILYIQCIKTERVSAFSHGKGGGGTQIIQLHRNSGTLFTLL
jgi:hypothetical protein